MLSRSNKDGDDNSMQGADEDDNCQEQHVTTWWASSDYLGHQAASRKCASFQAEEYQQRTLEKRKYNFSLKSLFDVKQKPKTRTDFFCDPSRFLVALFFPTGALPP